MSAEVPPRRATTRLAVLVTLTVAGAAGTGCAAPGPRTAPAAAHPAATTGSAGPAGVAGPARSAGPARATGQIGAPPVSDPPAPADPGPAPAGRSATAVDWAAAEVDVPANTTGCGAGRVRFRSGEAAAGAGRYRLGHWVSGIRVDPGVRHADVTGDGTVDTVLTLDCASGPDWPANPPELILVVSLDGAQRTLPVVTSVAARGFDGNGASVLKSVTAGGGVVRWTSQTWEGNGGGNFEARWSVDRFAVTAAP